MVQGFGINSVEVGEIEPKPVRRDKRTCLVDMVPEDVPQRPVEDVCTCVVLASAFPPGGIDRSDPVLAMPDIALDNTATVTVNTRERKAGIGDLDDTRFGCDRAGVPNLAARLSVERADVEEELDVAPLLCPFDAVALAQDRKDLPSPVGYLISDEVRRVDAPQELSVCLCLATGVVPLERSSRPVLLFGHGDVEARPVDGESSFGGDLLGQLDRETERVVELERGLAGNRIPIGKRLKCAIEHLLTGGERL